MGDGVGSECGDSVGVDVTGGDGASQACVKFFSLTKYTSTPLTHLHPSNYIHPLTLYIYPHTCTHPHTHTHTHTYTSHVRMVLLLYRSCAESRSQSMLQAASLLLVPSP